MRNRLKLLWELQLIDNELDEIEEKRGDLPREIRLLEEKYQELKHNLEERQNLREETMNKRIANEEDIVQHEADLKKFKSQLLQVRNNREYDALNKQIDSCKDSIESKKAENNLLADLSRKYSMEIEEITPELARIEEELKHKKKDLQKIDQETENEKKLKEKERERIISKIQKPDQRLYNRIRERLKRAVVPIKRNACDGCFATISSQRQLEIRRNDKIYTCESCGRILISNEIENIVENSNN